MAGTGGARPGAGRKPKDEENRIRDLMKPYSLDAVRCLAEIVANKDAKDSDRISASKLIIAYTYGNPKETVENTVTLNNFDIRTLYGEQTESDME
jgi:hypothetical protein